MNESKTVEVQGRRSRAEADRLVEEYEQSGMTRQGFSQARGISVHTLDCYRRRLRGPRPALTSGLLPVELMETSPQGGQLRIELASGRRIVVEEGFRPSLLRSVIAALEA